MKEMRVDTFLIEDYDDDDMGWSDEPEPDDEDNPYPNDEE